MASKNRKDFFKKKHLMKKLDTLREKLFDIHERTKEKDPEKLEELTAEWNETKDKYLQTERELRK